MASQNKGSGLYSFGSLFDSDDEENSGPSMPRIEADQETEGTCFNAYLIEMASQNNRSGSSSSSGSLFDSDDEQNSGPSMPRIEADRDTEELDSFLKRRSYLLTKMSFSKEEVDLACNKLGEGASLDQLVNWIVTAQEATVEVKIENCDEGDGAMDPQPDSTCAIVKAEEGYAGLLLGVMDKKLSLLQMGFSEEEVSSAMYTFGQEATIEELADSIFARRFANTTEQNQVKIESEFLDETENGHSTHQQRLRYYDDDDANIRGKKAKYACGDDRRASNSQKVNQASRTLRLSGCANGFPKNESLEMMSGLGRKFHAHLAKPLYFLYANVIDISKETWHLLSKFLFGVQPEFVNSQFFSALDRREGYIHNLPTERRHAVVPRSPRTVQDRLDPLQPHQMEGILGYPANHTDLPGLDAQEKDACMRFALQTDTVAYLLSVLKDLYPDGLRVLSINSGVGGAEVALQRLGILLRCVVSVEKSDVKRRILSRWWRETRQTGQLRQLPRVQELNATLLEALMKEFGGFDLVIGGNYSPFNGKMKSICGSMGMDSTQFFEYSRVVQSVRRMQRVAS